jgi:hypothetical protein
MNRMPALFTDLTRDYFSRTSARGAHRIIRRERRKQNLSHFLRHHDDGEIEDDETRDRDAIDNLLSYYGLLEVACAGALLEARFPAQFVDTAMDVLSDPAVRRYSEKHYPVTLPGAFRQRLESGAGPRDDATAQAEPLMFRFLDFNLIVEQDDDVDAFLWFREAGTYDDHNMDTVYATLADPRKLVRLFYKSPRRTDWTLRAIIGLQKFLEFSQGLAALLEEARVCPNLREAFYEQHAYWYLHSTYSVREVMQRVRTAFSQLAAQKDLLEVEIDPRRLQAVDNCLRGLEKFRDR